MASATAYTANSISALATEIETAGGITSTTRIAICTKGAMFHAIVLKP